MESLPWFRHQNQIAVRQLRRVLRGLRGASLNPAPNSPKYNPAVPTPRLGRQECCHLQKHTKQKGTCSPMTASTVRYATTPPQHQQRIRLLRQHWMDLCAGRTASTSNPFGTQSRWDLRQGIRRNSWTARQHRMPPSSAELARLAQTCRLLHATAGMQDSSSRALKQVVGPPSARVQEPEAKDKYGRTKEATEREQASRHGRCF